MTSLGREESTGHRNVKEREMLQAQVLENKKRNITEREVSSCPKQGAPAAEHQTPL